MGLLAIFFVYVLAYQVLASPVPTATTTINDTISPAKDHGSTTDLFPSAPNRMEEVSTDGIVTSDFEVTDNTEQTSSEADVITNTKRYISTSNYTQSENKTQVEISNKQSEKLNTEREFDETSTDGFNEMVTTTLKSSTTAAPKNRIIIRYLCKNHDTKAEIEKLKNQKLKLEVEKMELENYKTKLDITEMENKMNSEIIRIF